MGNADALVLLAGVSTPGGDPFLEPEPRPIGLFSPAWFAGDSALTRHGLFPMIPRG